MIYSPSRQFVFIHLPKTGGTAFTLSYEGKARKDDLLFGDTPKAQKRQKRFNAQHDRSLGKHSTFRDLIAALPDTDWRGVTLLAITRNPWDRMVSYYHWAKEQSFRHPVVDAARKHSFEAFVGLPMVGAGFRQAPFRSYLAHGLSEADAPKVQAFRFETLEDDAQTWAASCGFKLPPFGRVNASDRPARYQDCYSERTAELVGQIFADEIEQYGHRF